jgi:hypothetical protein
LKHADGSIETTAGHLNKQLMNKPAEKLFFYFLFPILFLMGCSRTDQEEKIANPGDEMVRIDLAGVMMDIPLHYMYAQSIEKWGTWHRPEKERAKVSALHLSMLLPDLRPYHIRDADKWKDSGHADRAEILVEIDKQPGKWFASLRKQMTEYAAAGKLDGKANDRYGLTHYSESNADTYLANDGLELSITCDRKDEMTPSPNCSVKASYGQGLTLNYFYGLESLPRWREIDGRLRQKMNKFTQVSATEKK